MDILYDIDGFCSLANLHTEGKSLAESKSVFEDKLIIIDSEPQSIDCLFEQYYLGLRSAIFIYEDTIKEESEAKEAMQTGVIEPWWEKISIE